MKAKWSIEEIWPFDVETTALLAIVVAFTNGAILGWMLAVESVK